MSATLTWFNSGLGTKTGTTLAAFFANLNTLVTSKAADANFSWEVAGASTATSPFYVVLRRKNGSAGRILFCAFSSTVATPNTTIFNDVVSSIPANSVFCSFFPSGTANVPSNLTTASGTIMGNDTNATYVTTPMDITAAYPTGYRQFYYDSAESVWLFCGATTGPQSIFFAAGNIAVDQADNAIPGVFAPYGFSGSDQFSSHTSNILQYSLPANDLSSSNSSTPKIWLHYNGNNKPYFFFDTMSAFVSAPNSSNVLINESTTDVYFLPRRLIGWTKGEGPVLKLRQVATGPGMLSQFPIYNATGPVTKALGANQYTSTNQYAPWFVNFKI